MPAAPPEVLPLPLPGCYLLRQVRALSVRAWPSVGVSGSVLGFGAVGVRVALGSVGGGPPMCAACCSGVRRRGAPGAQHLRLLSRALDAPCCTQARANSP